MLLMVGAFLSAWDAFTAAHEKSAEKSEQPSDFSVWSRIALFRIAERP
jgi:hypothetical protein